MLHTSAYNSPPPHKLGLNTPLGSGASDFLSSSEFRRFLFQTRRSIYIVDATRILKADILNLSRSLRENDFATFLILYSRFLRIEFQNIFNFWFLENFKTNKWKMWESRFSAWRIQISFQNVLLSHHQNVGSSERENTSKFQCFAPNRRRKKIKTSKPLKLGPETTMLALTCLVVHDAVSHWLK